MAFAESGRDSIFVSYAGYGLDYELSTDFVVVDVETSGFRPEQDARVLEISAVRMNANGHIQERFASLINPKTNFVGASHIHQIYPEMLDDAPTFGQIAPRLNELLSGAVFVAHNALFDETFLAAEYQRAGLNLMMMPGICTYWLGRNVLPQLPNHKLATLIEHFGVENASAHSAAADTEALAKIFPKMLGLSPRLSYRRPASVQETLGDYSAPKSR